MKKNKIRSPSFQTWSKYFDLERFLRLVNYLIYMVFAMLFLLVGKAIFRELFAKPPQPEDMSFMLIPYLGLPFAFWFFLGVGLLFGLTIHGFKIMSFNYSSKIEKGDKSG